MNINEAKVTQFLTIVKHMSMNRAAKDLHLSQPALSLSMQRLEEDLGVPLFYRSGNKLILSKEAEALLPRFKQLRNDFRNLQEEAENFRKTEDRDIVICFAGGVSFFATLYTSGFLKQYEGRAIQICFVGVPLAIEMLRYHRADFAISTEEIVHPSISSEVLYKEPFGLVVTKDHPLAGRTQLSMQDLDGLPMYGLARHHTFRRQCDRVFAKYSLRPDYLSSDDYTEYFHHLLSMNADTSALMARDAYEVNFHDRLRFLPVAEPDLCRVFTVSYRSDSTVQYKYEGLLQYLRDHLREQNLLHMRTQWTARLPV